MNYPLNFHYKLTSHPHHRHIFQCLFRILCHSTVCFHNKSDDHYHQIHSNNLHSNKDLPYQHPNYTFRMRFDYLVSYTHSHNRKYNTILHFHQGVAVLNEFVYFLNCTRIDLVQPVSIPRFSILYIHI